MGTDDTETRDAPRPREQSQGRGEQRHRNPITATFNGIVDLFRHTDTLTGLADDERIDGKTCLVTGANSGLGKAVAIQLAQRGGHVIMACRSGIPEAGEAVRRAAGSEAVEMLHVDLADLVSVHALCDTLRERGVRLDVVVLNAGLMPKRARRTSQGFEVMFGVHFLANRLLLQRWIEDGVVRLASGADSEAPLPRIVFVSSESHRSADPIDFERFGEFVDYGLRDGMRQYGSSKLHMCALAAELARRLRSAESGGGPAASVHALCPGPVASNIGREAPGLLKPVLNGVMRAFFRSPEQAAEPVLYLCCARAIEGRTGLYLHLMREKDMSPDASDEAVGRQLWETSAELLEPFANSTGPS